MLKGKRSQFKDLLKIEAISQSFKNKRS
ncbi:hypothetical protein FPSE_11244 [Fusarium pseudograminearum CS3096]|uniref:Uncharacterized protein n=1 Tax=Fusarium pseudograminearum (strain CS3096) TaxID=1028729 RepID=K3V678_FUSPC|nr:hypothetical protein FPSE_11244 [Fusarium pseudograminearum CS3096]EKJ68579.1 hypothetical protein FPSE_11244 [Fusarium pseudograminearum CS3096]